MRPVVVQIYWNCQLGLIETDHMGIFVVNEFTNHDCFSSPLKPLMLRLIRVSSCNSSSSTLLSRISLWFRRLAMLLASVCSVFDSLVLPRFCSGAFRHLSSQCLLCCLHCRLCCLLLAPRYFWLLWGFTLFHSPSSLSYDAFSSLVARAMHSLRFSSPCFAAFVLSLAH
jgi:hypothetical protein